MEFELGLEWLLVQRDLGRILNNLRLSPKVENKTIARYKANGWLDRCNG
jgi:hypothetical protein